MDIYVTEYILGEGAIWHPGGVTREGAHDRCDTTRKLQKAVEAGATIVYGTDAGVYPHGQNAKQLSRMTRFGMTPLQALQSATTVAAEVMGLGYEVGKLRRGTRPILLLSRGTPSSRSSC